MEKKETAEKKIEILASGRGWICVHKPSGMSIHNDPGKDLCSRLAGICAEDPVLSEKVNATPDFGIHPVHRIDAATSGIVLLALQKDVLQHFSRQFESRLVHKHYAAILHGLPKIKAGEEGVWDAPLSKKAGGRNNPKGSAPRVQCLTRYRVVRTTPHYFLALCMPETGRKHQIRRHAKIAGTQVLGDTRYGSKRALQYVSEKLNFNRLALHAQRLEVVSPGKTGKKLMVESPMPEEFTAFLDKDAKGF